MSVWHVKSFSTHVIVINIHFYWHKDWDCCTAQCVCVRRLVRLASLLLSHIHSFLCGNTGLFTILPGLDRLVISLIPWKARKCQTEELLISPREKRKKIKRQFYREYSWWRKGGWWECVCSVWRPLSGKVTNYAAKHTACIVKCGWKNRKNSPAHRKIEIQDK